MTPVLHCLKRASVAVWKISSSVVAVLVLFGGFGLFGVRMAGLLLP